MAGDELFGELPEQAKRQADAGPLEAPRLREPKRDQIELRAVDIESLIGEEHPVRVIWSYVEGLDLSGWRIASKQEATGPVIRRLRHDFCWHCGFMPPATASVARALWSGFAPATMPIAGCVAACR